MPSLMSLISQKVSVTEKKKFEGIASPDIFNSTFIRYLADRCEEAEICSLVRFLYDEQVNQAFSNQKVNSFLKVVFEKKLEDEKIQILKEDEHKRNELYAR